MGSLAMPSSTKSRMISLRLSDYEYRAVKHHCVVLGGLQISEFVRAAMMHALASPESSVPPTHRDLALAALYGRLEQLEQRLAGVTTHGNVTFAPGD